MISDYDLKQAFHNLHLLSPDQKTRVLALLEERNRLDEKQKARDSFIEFVKRMWPDVILGAHHYLMAEAYERVLSGETKRLIINIAPRHSKSEMTSWLLPLWFMGRNPKAKIMQCMNTQDLAAGFGRRVRNTLSKSALDTDERTASPYHEVFENMDLSKDSGASHHWHNIYGGEYYAVGVGGKIAGRGADLLVIDDPHSEQEAKMAVSNPDIFDQVYDWYVYGPRQRLQPGGRIIVVQTRWSKRDLTGRLLEKMKTDPSPFADKWEQIEFPAILDQGTENERALWPEYWPLETQRATRAALPVTAWESQYQQNPVSAEGAILKREYWKIWGEDTAEDRAKGVSSCPGSQHLAAWNNTEPPACDYIIMSLDSAIKKTERADFSAFTSWGVFKAEDRNTGRLVNNIILLDAYQARMDFPELKLKTRQLYQENMPDTLLIEDKGSGSSLIQELRSMGIPVEAFGYGRGSKALPNDKVARANMITDIFASGYVWAPPRRFADEVMTQCQEFPASMHDDLVDSTVQAMIRFRAGGFISTANDDYDDEEETRRYVRKRFY